MCFRQDHRGSIAWVTEAFGSEWGFIDAVWSFATSFLDNALYPLIIADFLGLSGALRWVFVYASIAALTWAVYRGSAVREETVFCGFITDVASGNVGVTPMWKIPWLRR